MCDHVSSTGQYDLYTKQHRCYKQEGEFDRFCNTGKHTCQSCRQKQTAGNLFLFRFCALIHSKSRTRKTKDHKDKFTGEIAGCVSTEMNNTRISQLSKEDVLTALYQLSGNFHCSADCCLPERKIEHMMQAERNQGTFDDTENQSTDITCSRNK